MEWLTILYIWLACGFLGCSIFHLTEYFVDKEPFTVRDLGGIFVGTALGLICLVVIVCLAFQEYGDTVIIAAPNKPKEVTEPEIEAKQITDTNFEECPVIAGEWR